MAGSTRGAARTWVAKKGETPRGWYVVDAGEWVLGRLAARVAMVLQGKHRPTYTPHVDTGEFVIVTNARQVRVTGKKRAQKLYRHWSGYVGGLKERTFEEMIKRNPVRVIKLAVRRMLPKSKLGRKMLGKLKVYSNGTHPHAAQQPEPFPGVPQRGRKKDGEQ